MGKARTFIELRMADSPSVAERRFIELEIKTQGPSVC